MGIGYIRVAVKFPEGPESTFLPIPGTVSVKIKMGNKKHAFITTYDHPCFRIQT